MFLHINEQMTQGHPWQRILKLSVSKKHWGQHLSKLPSCSSFGICQYLWWEAKLFWHTLSPLTDHFCSICDSSVDKLYICIPVSLTETLANCPSFHIPCKDVRLAWYVNTCPAYPSLIFIFSWAFFPNKFAALLFFLSICFLD